MPQSTDIVLNSAGYMITPGSPQSPGYRRTQDGMAEGLTQRTTQTDFFGGQLRSLQLERDTFATSLNVRPALGGQGITPWAQPNEYDVTSLSAPSGMIDKRIPHAIVLDRLWLAVGPQLWKGPITAPDTGGAWTLEKTFANPITDMCIYNSVGLLIAFGSAADIVYRNTLTGVEAALLSTHRAHYIENWMGRAIWNDARPAATPNIIQMQKGTGIDFRLIAHDPIAITTVGAELMIVTKQALYTYSGRVASVMVPNPAWTSGGSQPAQIPGEEWTSDFTPFYQQGVYTERDDFKFISGFGGRTIAWIANGVHELLPSGDRAGWRSTGLTGRRCFGGTVAAGYVIVCIESHDAKNQVWAYDGNGWWCIASKPMPTAASLDGTWCWPFPLGSGSVYRNVGCFHAQTNKVTRWRLVETMHNGSGYITHYPTEATYVSSMIDAGERDKPKAWRKVGAVFASPELNGDTTSTDGVILTLDYSIDAGATWTAAATTTKTANTLASNNFELTANLSGLVSPFIMLRVRWESINNWAPILTGVWVEHEVLENPARRRKWQLRIHARDQEVDRDGVLLTRTGRQLIAELWNAWETDTPLPFRDIDYDDAPTQRTVRIVGISEAVTQPFDSNQWGDSIITLNLVEV